MTSRKTTSALYLLTSTILIAVLWSRSLSYVAAVTCNDLETVTGHNEISQSQFQELPQLPFIYYTSLTTYSFGTSEWFQGWDPLSRTFAESKQPNWKTTSLRCCDCNHLISATPLFIRIRSLRC